MKYRTLLISFIAVFLVAVSSTKSSGQVPGYLGKRFLFSYDAKVSPNLYKFIDNPQHGNPIINYMHNLEVEYVIAQGGVIGLTAKYTRNQFDLQNDYQTAVLDDGETTGGIVDFKAIAFSYKAFKRSKGMLAPLGPYFKSEFGLGQLSFRPELERYENELIFKDSYLVPFIGIGIGKQFILWDYMLVDMGMELTTPFNFFPVLTGTTPVLNLNQKRNDDNAHKRMYRQLFFNFRIGVGLAAF